jgi:diguanylate cyclase (GGDEF)-like protein
VLFLDLDGFKLINDSFGHDVGDQLLSRVALRLRDSVRTGDTVARLGGDEFVVLCEHPGSEEEMIELSERLIAVISQPFRIHGHDELRVGASVGIAHRTENEAGMTDLIREADIALYRAKHEGRGRTEVFDSSLVRA